MSPTEVLLQFGTVFLGAFLAFVLEHVRERRRLRGWVRRYLEQFYGGLQESITTQKEVVKTLRASIEVYQRFAKAEPDVTAPQTAAQTADEWNALLAMSYSSGGDFSLLLEGDTLRALPAEVVRALSRLQKVNDANGILSRLLADPHGRYVVPIALNKT